MALKTSVSGIVTAAVGLFVTDSVVCGRMPEESQNDDPSRAKWFAELKEAHGRSEEFGLQSSHALDKSLLALSGGAIGVSLTFLDALQASLSWPLYLLYATWLGFTGCIYFTIRSMREATDRLAEETTFYNLVLVPELGGTLSDEETKERDKALKDSKRLLTASRSSNKWARRSFYAALTVLLFFAVTATREARENMGRQPAESRPAPEPSDKKGYTGGGINPVFVPKPQPQGGSGGSGGGNPQSGGEGGGQKPSSGS